MIIAATNDALVDKLARRRRNFLAAIACTEETVKSTQHSKHCLHALTFFVRLLPPPRTVAEDARVCRCHALDADGTPLPIGIGSSCKCLATV
jgi:hypothetical protein